MMWTATTLLVLSIPAGLTDTAGHFDGDQVVPGTALIRTPLGNRHIIGVRLFSDGIGVIERTDSTGEQLYSKLPWSGLPMERLGELEHCAAFVHATSFATGREKISLPEGHSLIDADARGPYLLIATRSNQGFKDGELGLPFDSVSVYLIALPTYCVSLLLQKPSGSAAQRLAAQLSARGFPFTAVQDAVNGNLSAQQIETLLRSKLRFVPQASSATDTMRLAPSLMSPHVMPPFDTVVGSIQIGDPACE